MKNIWYSILSLACWLAPLCVLAQERYKPDSLIQILDRAKGRERVEILRHLSRAYIGADKEKSVGYAKASLAEAEKLDNDTFIVRSLNNLASALQNCGDHPGSMQYLDRAINITRINGNRIQLLESLEFKAVAYAGRKQTDKAIPFAQEALAISEELKDSVGIINALEIIAAGYKDLQQYDEAIKIYQKEIGLLEHLPKRIFEKARVSVNMGETYAKMNRRQEAVVLFEKGRQYFTEFGYPVGALIATSELADCFLDEGLFEKASVAYHQILEANKVIQEPELSLVAHTGLGTIALEKSNYREALIHFKEAESIAKLARHQVWMKDIYDYMKELYCLQGDYETAKTYKKLSKSYADSVLTSDVRDRITELQIQYETAEKELQIAQQKTELYRTNVLNYSLLAGLLAFLGFGYLFYNRFRLRKKAELAAAIIREQKLGLSAVIEAQEAERKRIARDLHDGIAQELIALKLGFDALGRRIGKIAPGEAPIIAELGEQMNSSCIEVRSIAHVMSPPVLEQQGLAPSLELLLRHTLDHAGLEAQFKAHDLPLQLDEKTEIGLYRIAQELLNNVVKHAHAAKVWVELFQSENQLILRVEDDGKGFDFDAARMRGTMGVLNILSRVSNLGGEFFSERKLPQGTVSLVRVPV